MKSVFKNFIYNTGYQLLTILIPVITTPYLARIIGAENIGKYSYANSIAYYFVMFIMLGLNNYGNRTIAQKRDDKDQLSKTFCEIYVMQLIIGILVMGLYILFCIIFMKNNIIQWMMIIYVFSAILDINWFFFGIEQFKFTVLRNTVIKLITTVCIFSFVKKTEDIYVYILISVLGNLLSNFVLWTAILKFVNIRKVKMQDVLSHFKPNLVLFIPIVAVSLYKYMDKIMLGIMCNMTQVGFYEYSEKIIQIPIALVNSLGTVMLPQMANIVANNRSGQEKKYISMSIVLAMFCSSSLCFGLMGIAKEFVPVFYGAGYEECVKLFYILLPSCCFIAFANVIRTQYLIPHKKDFVYIKSVILGAVINLILNLILIKILYSEGAAIATLVAEMVVCIYQALKTKNEIDIKDYIKNSVPFVLSGIFMFLIILNIKFKQANLIANMFIKIAVGAVAYFGLLFVFLLFSRKRGWKIINFNKER